MIHGVGIMDLNTRVCIKLSDGSRWTCPYYTKWASMLERCYSERYQNLFPTYKGCEVDISWHKFSNFKAWMLRQDWLGLELDKDILFEGNKIYSENTCAFVTKEVNYVFSGNFSRKYQYPLGVDFHKRSGKFRARCRLDGKDVFLGHYTTPEMAHKAWQSAKISQILSLVEHQSREDIQQALARRVDKVRQDLDNSRETEGIK